MANFLRVAVLVVIACSSLFSMPSDPFASVNKAAASVPSPSPVEPTPRLEPDSVSSDGESTEGELSPLPDTPEVDPVTGEPIESLGNPEPGESESLESEAPSNPEPENFNSEGPESFEPESSLENIEPEITSNPEPMPLLSNPLPNPVDASSNQSFTPDSSVVMPSPNPGSSMPEITPQPLPSASPGDSVASAPSVSDVPENPADTLTLTEKSMSFVQGDVATRTQLIDTATQSKSDAQQAVTRLGSHKDSWYEKYLALDEKLDRFYEKTGFSRGHLEDDVDTITDALVAKGIDKKNIDDAKQAEVTAYDSKVRELGSQARDVAHSEKELLESVRTLSERIDSALDISANIQTLASEIRGLARDEDAQAQVKKIAELVAQINTIEKELESELIPKLDKAFIDIDAKTQKVTSSIEALKAQGVAFEEYARQVVDAREHDEKQEAEKSDEGEEGSAENAEKKKKKRKQAVSFKSNGLVGVASHYAYEAYLLLKPAIAALGFIVYEIAQALRRAWGYVMKSAQQVEEESFASKIDATVKDDAVLEKIRQQRNESYRKLQEISAQRKITQEKERELDRLEYERKKRLGLATTPLEKKLDSDNTLLEHLTEVFKKLGAIFVWLFEFIVGLIKAIFGIEK